MGFFRSPHEKQAQYILEMIDEMGKDGRRELREELNLDRKGLAEIEAGLERILKMGLGGGQDLDDLEIIVKDIHRDAMETQQSLEDMEDY